jgi:membrane associated rhomboid family serine protease
MLLPVSHEEVSVSRLPWVSFGVIVACLLAFVALNLTMARRLDESRGLMVEAIEYFVAHPKLRVDPRLLPPALLAQVEPPPAGAAAPATPLQQRELDRRTAQWLAATERDPLWQGGLVPAQPRAASYLTHAFLHGGWLHLLGNLLFFYLTAPFVEDRWGRWRFLAFYLVAALVSGGVFASFYPQLFRPLVGASGAISAVMAAFLVEFSTTRLSFLFMPLFPLPPYIPFRMPAWLVFPAWFATDLVSAVLADERSPGTGGGGVAFWAHVAGFLFGLAIAIGVRMSRRSGERHERRDRRSPAGGDSLALAQAAAQGGDLERAWALVVGSVQLRGSDEGALLLWTLARRLRDPGRGAPALEAVIRRGLRGGREVDALARWRELAAACPEHAIDPALAAALLELLAARGERRELALRMASTLDGLDERAPAGTVLRLLRLAQRHDLDARDVRLFAGRFLREAALTAAERRELEAMVG